MGTESLDQQANLPGKVKNAGKTAPVKLLVSAAVIGLTGALGLAATVLFRPMSPAHQYVPPMNYTAPGTCFSLCGEEGQTCAEGLECTVGYVGNQPIQYCGGGTCPKLEDADTMLAFERQSCSCNGSFLHCDTQNYLPAADAIAPDYCDADYMQEVGDCSCGANGDLTCQVSVCKFEGITHSGNVLCQVFGCSTSGSAPCNPATFTNPYSSSPGIGGGPSTIVFPNYPWCGPVPPIEAPSSTVIPQPGVGLPDPVGIPDPGQTDVCANNGGVQYQGTTCVCPGVVDNVTICNDGTKLDQVSNVPCPDAQNCGSQGSTGDGGSVECGCGLYGASYGGLGCSDGTITECVEACGCKP